MASKYTDITAEDAIRASAVHHTLLFWPILRNGRNGTLYKFRNLVEKFRVMRVTGGIISDRKSRLRNDLYCVEWDVKLYYTIPFGQKRQRSRSRGPTDIIPPRIFLATPTWPSLSVKWKLHYFICDVMMIAYTLSAVDRRFESNRQLKASMWTFSEL